MTTKSVYTICDSRGLKVSLPRHIGRMHLRKAAFASASAEDAAAAEALFLLKQQDSQQQASQQQAYEKRKARFYVLPHAERFVCEFVFVCKGSCPAGPSGPKSPKSPNDGMDVNMEDSPLVDVDPATVDLSGVDFASCTYTNADGCDEDDE